MNIFRTTLLLILAGTISAGSLFAQQKQVADKIVAIVNDRIILKSDVDNEVRQYLQQAELDNQQVSFSEDLWYSALESIVDNHVMLEKAEMDSVVVSDEMVNRAMDERIRGMVRQAGSEEALERALGNSIVQIRAEFRETFREQMVTQQLQQRRMERVEITRPEVREFFNEIPTDQLPTIPEQVEVSQIVVTPPELDDARNIALQRAQTIRDSVVNMGMDFEEMARKHSAGPSAPRGGLLPMMPLGDLVANYSAAAAALDPGEISEVVRTDFGYHIIRLNQRQGDSIETNHILIEIDEESVDDDFAKNKLEMLRDSVLNHNKRFRDLARVHSEDEATKPSGGRIINRETGERRLTIGQLEPSLYRIVLLLDEEGEISEPRPFTMPGSNKRAYRIVRLDRHIPEHLANLEDDYDQIKGIALQRKQMRVLSEWLEVIREDVYVEYKIEMPSDVEQDLDMMLEDPTPVGAE